MGRLTIHGLRPRFGKIRRTDSVHRKQRLGACSWSAGACWVRGWSNAISLLINMAVLAATIYELAIRPLMAGPLR